MVKILNIKYALIILLSVSLFSFSGKHPFYLGVTELKYNAKEKTIQTSVKLFTNDLEDALKKISKKKVDLINGTNKEEINKLLSDYISSHLKLKLNGKVQTFHFVGYEQEQDALWTYLEYKNCSSPKKIEIENTLLFDYITTQINIVQVEINGEKKSSKCTNPEKNFSFQF